MIEALLVNAFFGLASLSFECHAAKSIDQSICENIKTEAIKHGIPVDKSKLLGQVGRLEVTINTTSLGITDEDSPYKELVVVVTKFIVKRPLVDADDSGGHIYNAVVYMYSDTAFVQATKATKRAYDISNHVIDEISNQWNKSHHRDKT